MSTEPEQSFVRKYRIWIFHTIVMTMALTCIVYYCSNRVFLPLGEFQLKVDEPHKEFYQQRVSTVLNEYEGKGFMQVSLASLLKEVEQDPWIEHPRIRRVWPPALEVKLDIPNIIASYQEQYFVTESGRLLPAEQYKHDSTIVLPQFEGNQDKLADMIEKLHFFENILGKGCIKVISVSDYNSWQVRLTQGTTLYWGRQQFEHKSLLLQKLLEHYALEQLQVIDLRYSSGVAITKAAKT